MLKEFNVAILQWTWKNSLGLDCFIPLHFKIKENFKEDWGKPDIVVVLTLPKQHPTLKTVGKKTWQNGQKRSMCRDLFVEKNSVHEY